MSIVLVETDALLASSRETTQALADLQAENKRLAGDLAATLRKLEETTEAHIKHFNESANSILALARWRLPDFSAAIPSWLVPKLTDASAWFWRLCSGVGWMGELLGFIVDFC